MNFICIKKGPEQAKFTMSSNCKVYQTDVEQVIDPWAYQTRSKHKH